MLDRNDQIDAYLEGELPEHQFEDLRGWLLSDAANAKHFAMRAMLHDQIRRVLQRSRIESLQAPGRMLKELLEMERRAPILQSDALPKAGDAVTDTPDHNSVEPLKWSDIGAVARHLFGVVGARRLAVLATAAAVLLAAALVVVLIAVSEPQDRPPMAESTDQPAVSSPVVATLTAERDAKWGRRPGEDLYAGQRFTLVQGRAEITTQRGAIAILQAPATIEFTDHDNAIRLHAGKLFGICETEASKGFLVRTPHMQVTDLGTRFGIDASADTTDVHVFSGEVQARHINAKSTDSPTRLTVGQSASAAQGSTAITQSSTSPGAFVRSFEQSTYQTPEYVLAYYRYEEGTPGQDTPHIGGKTEDFSQVAVIDHSAHGNVLYAYTWASAPTYSGQPASRLIPQTGELNFGAIDDSRPGEGRMGLRNLYTFGQRSNPSRAIEDVELTQWTIEASVMPTSLEGEQTYVARSRGINMEINLGLADGRFVAWLEDGSGQRRVAQSEQRAELGKWTHLAATCDGQVLTLYAKGNGDSDYQQLGQTPVDRAMQPKPQTRNVPPLGVQIGGYQAGMDALAVIDEVRISTKALETHELLFSEPNTNKD